jgi:23S rRNA pseudouridine2605 synthase
MTAPARLRLLRDAENPWYEMILIEGRNREIRKMFEEVGHHVEKIRRVGYGPLVLDLEPGLSRELTLDEVAALRKAAEGRPTKAAPGTSSWNSPGSYGTPQARAAKKR